MSPHQMFVLHSPYPDWTWRGIEKCRTVEDGAGGVLPVLLYTSREDAQTVLDAMSAETRPHFRVVEVTVFVPHIRDPLDSATQARVVGLIP